MEIRLVITSALIVLPSLIWLLMNQAQSPWWLENISASPFIILPIFCVLILILVTFISIGQSFSLFVVNFIIAVCINNATNLHDKPCIDSIRIFQFNTKFQTNEAQLTLLAEHLISEKYHLIALQGVSQRAKKQLIKKLNPYFPHFISGGRANKPVFSDQLLFSRYAFTNVHYIKSGESAYLINSQWQLPFIQIDLHSLHPPSPRSELLWGTRNKVLYQLKQSLNEAEEGALLEPNGLLKSSLVIGDLNLSKHSNRIKHLKGEMKSKFVNSWPQKPFIPMLLGLAIDQLWVSKSANICSRERISHLTWSDHYAIKTQLNFIK
ncbi:MAG: endonuclease/exonuclease/phosphatase family protein [Colwellia sp.]|nr:endonuclease/exonuclease/phosphatase family protein [Colwellia sp.]